MEGEEEGLILTEVLFVIFVCNADQESVPVE
jgi:hypothetical protein